MSTLRKNVSLVGLGLIVVAGTAGAQIGMKPGSAPLAAGSTAAEIQINSSTTGSLLRFSEANEAWIFSASASLGNKSTKVAGVSNSGTDIGLNFGVGKRHYKGEGAFHPFTGYGALLGFTSSSQPNGAGGSVTTSGFDLGPYYEMGGVYFLTSRFSVGAASSASLTISSQSTGGGGGSSTGFTLSGSLIGMFATVYF